MVGAGRQKTQSTPQNGRQLLSRRGKMIKCELKSN